MSKKMMSDVLVSRCVLSLPVSRSFSQRPVLSALPGPENTPFPIGISHHLHRAAMYPEKRVSVSGPLSLSGRLSKGGGREGKGRGRMYVVYPVMTDTRTGRCNSRRQHTYSQAVEKGPVATLPYHHTGEYPRQCNPPLFIPPRQTPGCFCPVDPDGQSCPGSCRTRILLTETVAATV